MAGVNKVILVGNLGKDPEVRYTPSGSPVASFSLATTERYNDKSGQRQERTEWHNIIFWNRLAEICQQYLRKGSSIYLEGRIQTRSWDDRDGNKRYTTEIIGNAMQIIGSRGAGAGEDSRPQPDASRPPYTPPGGPGPAPDQSQPKSESIPQDDDLPF